MTARTSAPSRSTPDAQRAAWAQLWRILLSEPTATNGREHPAGDGGPPADAAPD